MFESCSSHRQTERERAWRTSHARCNPKQKRPLSSSRSRLSLSLSPCSSTMVNNNNNSTRAARGCSGSVQNTESGVVPNCGRNLFCPLTHAPSSFALTAARNHLFRATLARAGSLLPLSRKDYVTDRNEGVSGSQGGKGKLVSRSCVTRVCFFAIRDRYIERGFNRA